MDTAQQKAAPAPAPPLKVGDVIDSKYRIEGMLGEGSFAWVYIANHAQVSSLSVAIKVLKSEHVSEEDIVKRFHREAETAAALKNRHIIRITDFGFISTGAPYLAMEFVRGMTMADLLARNGPLSDLEVARLSVHILKALEEAHGLGIVHRDLKPDNVYVVDEPGEDHAIARVLDFGIAKIMDSATGVFAGADQTAAGMLYCTPRYASPELLKGFPSPQSDLYALGITMIELLDGEPPYRGDDFYAVAAKHVSAEPVPLGPRVEASALRDIVAKSVAKKTEERYKTAKEMRHELSDIMRKLEAASSAPTPVVAMGLRAARTDVGSAPTLASGEFASALGTEGREILAAAALAAAAQGDTSGPAPVIVTADPQPAAVGSVKGSTASVAAADPADTAADTAEDSSSPDLDAQPASGQVDSIETAAFARSRAPLLLVAGVVGVIVLLLLWKPWSGGSDDGTNNDASLAGQGDTGIGEQVDVAGEPDAGVIAVAAQGSGEQPDAESVDGGSIDEQAADTLVTHLSGRALQIALALIGSDATDEPDVEHEQDRDDREEREEREREEREREEREREEREREEREEREENEEEGSNSQTDEGSNPDEGSGTDPNPFGNLGVRGGRGSD